MLAEEDLLAATLLARREGQAARKAVAQLGAQAHAALALVESVAREALQLGRAAGEEAAKGQDAAADAHAAADRGHTRSAEALAHLRGEVNNTVLALAAAARQAHRGHAAQLQALASALAAEIRRLDPLVAAVAQIQNGLPATAEGLSAARQVADEALRLADLTAKRLKLQRPTSRISHQWRGSKLQLRNADGTFSRAVDLRGAAGERGPRGPAGPIGPMPKHRWNGTALAFEVAPGQFGEFVELRGPRGARGAGGGISSRGLSEAQVLALIQEHAASSPSYVELERPAAVPLGGHRVVYSAPDGLRYASSDDGTADAALGVTTHAAAAGEIVRVVTFGSLSENSWAWTPEEPVWLGANGLLTQIAPAAGTSLQVAVAKSATALHINLLSPVSIAL